MRAGKFATEDGLSVELQGDVADALKSPRGAVQWVVAAPTRQTFATLVGLLDLPEDMRRQADAFAALSEVGLRCSRA